MLEGEAKGHLHWRVCLGPGRVLEEVAPILAHLGRPSAPSASRDLPAGPGTSEPGAFHGVQVDQLSDVAELMRAGAGAGRLILAGDGFPEEDIGFVRRFLANNPAWELVVLGRDAGARVPRLLLSLERARWVHLPPDLDQLRDLARPPATARPAPDGGLPREGAAPPAAPPADPKDPELPPGARGDPQGSTAPDRSRSPVADRSGPATATPPTSGPADGAPARPQTPSQEARRPLGAPPQREPGAPTVRHGAVALPAGARGPAPLGDYVGPLADLVQRVDLSVGMAREAVPGSDLAAGEVHQLRQMTHMMKRVAAPPPRGAERFDAGELFEERLAAMTIQSPRALRFLPRGERGHHVRADRAAVSEALASLLALARGCTAPSGVVMAPFEATPEGCVRLELEFPAGPLAGADVERLLEPGGLSGRVDGLGAADLPAALSVARSQGGDLQLASEPGDRLRAVLELPLDS